MRKILLISILLFSIPFSIIADDLSLYSLNIYNPLILNGSRATGMAGAVVSLGDNADDIFYNCASSSLRNKFQKSTFEWDYSLSFANVFSKSDIDYRNARSVFSDYIDDDLIYYSLGLILIHNSWSLSITFAGSSITIGSETNRYILDEQLITINLAYEFVPNVLYIGVGLTVPRFELRDSANDKLLSYNYREGVLPNPQIGIIFNVPGSPLKLGVNALLNLNGTVNTNTNASAFTAPKEIRHPMKLVLGASWKFDFNNSIKPLSKTNILSKTKKSKRKKGYSWTPEFCILAVDIEIVGRVQDGVDILSYTGGTNAYRSGESVLVQPRVGVEFVFPDWLKLGAGYYFEGPRISGTRGRHHVTFNSELDLITLFGLDIAVSFTLDYARDFFSAGFGAKIWKY